MPSSIRIAAAVADAVIDLPIDLCNLTASYLIEIPHKFKPFETVQTTDKTNIETDIVGTDHQHPFPWHTITSASTFETGHLHWIVDCVWRPRHGWIGVGVTRSSENHGGLKNAESADIAGMNDWIVCPRSSGHLYSAYNSAYNDNSGAFAICHDGRFTNPVQIAAIAGQNRFRADCIADPTAGTVTVRIDGLADAITILSAGSIDVRLLRPCVVVAGLATATFRSGGSE